MTTNLKFEDKQQTSSELVKGGGQCKNIDGKWSRGCLRISHEGMREQS